MIYRGTMRRVEPGSRENVTDYPEGVTPFFRTGLLEIPVQDQLHLGWAPHDDGVRCAHHGHGAGAEKIYPREDGQLT